jgi:hypothetical protein
MNGRRKAWPDRHSQPGCCTVHEVGAAPRAPCGAAPSPVSTATGLPKAKDNAPLLSNAVVAVLTIFEGQAIYRIIGSDAFDLPNGLLFRLRGGSRDVTGGRL